MNAERPAKGLRPFPPRPFGRYTLLAPLAMGGMGEIFLGRMEGAQGFEKWVVIKRILPQLAQEQDFVDRFVTEAKILVKLHHGSVGQVLDMGQIDGDFYIALEFVDGKDLRKVATRCRERNFPLPQGLALYVMGRVVDALAYAHRKKGDDDHDLNLVHRDVSPQNILVSYEGEVKVIDFGLAKSSLASGRTNPSVILGKFFYMSPEQAQHGTVDRRSDLYAAGIVLYELIAGRNPFDGVPPAEIITRVAHPSIEPLGMRVPGLSPNLEAVVMKALAVDPKERFASAEEMRGRLMGAMLEIDPTAGPESMAQFMRAVFAGEYAQERKVFASLREAATGGSVGVAPTMVRPKVDAPAPEAVAPTAARIPTAPEGVSALKYPSMARTTTIDAVPSAPEEFSFPVSSAVLPAQRSTDPARPMISLPDLPESLPAVPAAAALGHTVPFSALSLTSDPGLSPPPAAPAPPTAELASSSDPQEWLAPGGAAHAPVEESHTTPFAALTAELPHLGETAVNPMPPPGVGDSGPTALPAWELPPESASLGARAGAITLPPTPGVAGPMLQPPGPVAFAVLPAAPPLAPAPAAVTTSPRLPARAPGKVSSPKLPAAPKVAAGPAPSIVIAPELMQPEAPGGRPTIQVDAIGGAVEQPPPRTGVEHLSTSPVLAAAAPAAGASAPPPPATQRPPEPTSPTTNPTMTTKPGKPLTSPPAPAPTARPTPKTEPSPMSNVRAGLFVVIGAGLGLAILGLAFMLRNYLR